MLGFLLDSLMSKVHSKRTWFLSSLFIIRVPFFLRNRGPTIKRAKEYHSGEKGSGFRVWGLHLRQNKLQRSLLPSKHSGTHAVLKFVLQW